VSVRWAREHPRLSVIALCVVGIMAAGSLLLAIVGLVSARWGEAVYWLVSAGFGVWVFWSWVRIRRGELRPGTWGG